VSIDIEHGVSARDYYLALNQNKRVLMSLCIGLGVGDMKKQPYESARKKSTFKPSNNILANEVLRRFYCQQASDNSSKKLKPVPKPKHWNEPHLKEWLQENPITDLADISFVLEREAEFRNLIQSTNTEPPIASQDGFYTLKSILCLYHAMTEDSVREHLCDRNNLSTRLGTDARGNDSRPATWHEHLAKLYNKSSYRPVSLSLPHLHDDFAESMLLDKDFQQPVTPDQLKKKVADFKAKLVIILSKYEQSGNGDGQRQESDPNFGRTRFAHRMPVDDNGISIETMTFMEGDNKRSFLCGYPSHILYFWNLMDTCNILAEVRETISNTVAADSNSVSSTTSTRKRRKGDGNIVDGNSVETDDSTIGSKDLKLALVNALNNVATSQLDSSSGTNAAHLHATLASVNQSKTEALKLWMQEKRVLSGMAVGSEEYTSQTEIVDVLKDNYDDMKTQATGICNLLNASSTGNVATPVRNNRSVAFRDSSSSRLAPPIGRTIEASRAGTPVSQMSAASTNNTEFSSALDGEDMEHD
jgi:hypothetical protein